MVSRQEASTEVADASAPAGRARRLWSWLRRCTSSEAPSEADPRVERLARVVALLSSVWFVLAACWELTGPFGAGHVASSSAMGIAAENMLKFEIFGPVAYYPTSPPVPSNYYCNHPWGTFWTTVVSVKLFGHQDVACRLPPIVMSALTPPLLYGIGRQLYGPVAGALAALSFVVVPVALAFANFNALEVPVIFGLCVATWGYLRLTRTWRRRWVAVSAFGFFHAFNSDWAAFFFGAVVLAFMLPRGILFNGRWFSPVDRRRFAQWWALAAASAVFVVLFYVFQFQRAGQLANLLQQGVHRSAGSNLPLSAVLESRADWIDLAFTPLAIFVGKAAVPLFVIRLLALRRDQEIFPLGFLVMAVVQYVVFKQGADIHFFWPQYFAPYFALSVAAFAGSLAGILRWLSHKLGRSGRIGPPILALAGFALVPLSMIPDAVRGLVYARRTGGRYDERGDLIHQDIDKVSVLGQLRKRFESNTTVAYHQGMKVSWHVDWATRRPSRVTGVPAGPATGESQYYFVDSRFIYAAELEKLVRSFHVEAYGPIWFVDRSRRQAPIDGFAIHSREPSRTEWYFQRGNDPFYTVAPDAFVTWELRWHFGQEPNPAPGSTPASFEQRRIAHNLAVARGRSDEARRLLQELEAELSREAAVGFIDGTRLLGTRRTSGVAPRLWTCFVAARPIAPDAMFHITTEVTQKAKWSWVPAPSRIRAVGMPFELPTSLWKPGFVYCTVSELRPRPGTEVLTGVWGARQGAPELPTKAGDQEIELLTLTE